MMANKIYPYICVGGPLDGQHIMVDESTGPVPVRWPRIIEQVNVVNVDNESPYRYRVCRKSRTLFYDADEN